MTSQPPSQPIRILLGDQPSMWRDGLRALLNGQPDLEVVGDPAEHGPLLPLTLKHRPHIVLCGADLEQSAVSDLQVLRDQGIFVRVIAFGSTVPTENLFSTIRLGASALPQPRPLGVLPHIYREGNRSAKPRDTSSASQGAGPSSNPLSPRERELVKLVALGFRNREIADKLYISEQTVKNHLRNVFGKTNIKDRLELAIYAVYHNLYD